MQKLTRMIAVVLVALAVLLAITAVTLGKKTGVPAPVASSAPPVAPTQPVVVAVHGLPPGVVMSADELEVVQQAQRPPGSYSRVDQVAGRVPAQKIAAGVPVTAAVIAHGLGLQLNPGERAVAVPVDELTGAGNRIEPGDYVDVFLELGDKNIGNAEQVGQTRLLLSRLRVLAYGADDLDRRAQAQDAQNQKQAQQEHSAGGLMSSASPAGGAGNGSGNAGSNPQPAHSAVLAVSVQNADVLLLGAQNGKLFLALRHPGDTGLADSGLFPGPKPVLLARKELSRQQRQSLLDAENHAFAGLDSTGLAGRPPHPLATAAPSSAPREPRDKDGIEIIRGDGRGTRPPGL